MNQVKQTLRRSGMISLLGSFAAVLILAVINGSIGYLCAMSVTLFGALGVAKALGEPIWLSYEWIIALAVGCGILRGLLRYIEQYSNHYIAFHLLAILRDKIFGVLRKLCPAGTGGIDWLSGDRHCGAYDFFRSIKRAWCYLSKRVCFF